MFVKYAFLQKHPEVLGGVGIYRKLYTL